MAKTEKKSYPLLPLRNILVFPGTTTALEVGRTRSVKAVEIAQSSDMRIAMCTQKDNDIVDPLPEHISEVGTLGLIKEIEKTSQGHCRIVIESLPYQDYFLSCDRSRLRDCRGGNRRTLSAAEAQVAIRTLTEQYEEYVRSPRRLARDAHLDRHVE